MCFFKRKKQKQLYDVEVLPVAEIADIMYNKNLQFSDKVMDIIYSKDKTKRYVLLERACDNNYTFVFQSLEIFNADELLWMKTDSLHPEEGLPAYWIEVNHTISIFDTFDDAVNGIEFEPQYRQYFR